MAILRLVTVVTANSYIIYEFAELNGSSLVAETIECEKTKYDINDRTFVSFDWRNRITRKEKKEMQKLYAKTKGA